MANTKRKVKRTYASTLRDDHARTTRKAIVDAAAALFAEHGYNKVSVDAIAAQAGVSRATVFTSVGKKPALIAAAFESAFARAAGGEPGVRFVDRPESVAVRALPTAHEYIRGYAAIATALNVHLARINEALREASTTDPEARKVYEETTAIRRRGADTIVADIRARKPPRNRALVDDAADVVWTLIDPSMYFKLVHERGWKPARYTEWLVHFLETTLYT